MHKDGGDMTFNVLLIEDNASDILLLEEALVDTGVDIRLHVVNNGEQALGYLHRHVPYEEAVRPDLVLLDLNLPVKHGFVVLEEIKVDPDLKSIPVIIFSTSMAEEDIERSYRLYANCYINKPFDLEGFMDIIRNISQFWMQTVKLPKRKKNIQR